jgi:hypothetical protein
MKSNLENKEDISYESPEGKFEDTRFEKRFAYYLKNAAEASIIVARVTDN